MKKVKIYTRFERLWHWAQALVIMGLMVTGLEIHYPNFISVLGFDRAVDWHRILAWTLLVIAAFAIFWHMTTGAWKQYFPVRGESVGTMIEYYLFGMFKMRKHPARKTPERKLNPLQKMVYLAFKLLIFPVLVLTGILYMYWDVVQGQAPEWLTLGLVAIIHSTAAFFLIAFLFGHVYMTTTGYTKSSNLRAMINGWEVFDEDDLTKHA